MSFYGWQQNWKMSLLMLSIKIQAYFSWYCQHRWESQASIKVEFKRTTIRWQLRGRHGRSCDQALKASSPWHCKGNCFSCCRSQRQKRRWENASSSLVKNIVWFFSVCQEGCTFWNCLSSEPWDVHLNKGRNSSLARRYAFINLCGQKENVAVDDFWQSIYHSRQSS